MGWIVAGILVALGVGLIAAGSSGSANALFESITGIDVPGTATTPATTPSTTSGSSGTLPGGQGTVGQTSGITGVAA